MKTAIQILNEELKIHCTSSPYTKLEEDVIIEIMKKYAIQYRLCAMADEKICNTQCFTCSEDEDADFKNLNKALVIGQVCGTCEKEMNLFNVKYKKWYCCNCKKYLPQTFL